jgi:hypothetical protein
MICVQFRLGNISSYIWDICAVAHWIPDCDIWTSWAELPLEVRWAQGEAVYVGLSLKFVQTKNREKGKEKAKL